MWMFVTSSVDGSVQCLEHQRIGASQPGAEFCVIEPLGQFAQPIEIEAAVSYSEPNPRRVNGVDLLLDMILDGHEE
jgi:hypothetical protein